MTKRMKKDSWRKTCFVIGNISFQPIQPINGSSPRSFIILMSAQFSSTRDNARERVDIIPTSVFPVPSYFAVLQTDSAVCQPVPAAIAQSFIRIIIPVINCELLRQFAPRDYAILDNKDKRLRDKSYPVTSFSTTENFL